MNIKDPYIEMMNIIRKHGAYYNPSTVEIGKVISISPLTISVDDLPITKDKLLIADYLQNNYSRDLQINGTTQTYITQNGLNENDLLALIQINSNQYLILCKVVSAT